MICEQRLIKLCSIHSFVYIYHVADLYNANRLKEFCLWYQRINPAANEQLLLHQHQEAAAAATSVAEEEAKGTVNASNNNCNSSSNNQLHFQSHSATSL